MLDAGVRPNEMALRLSGLLSGALLLLVAPWWAARRIGRGLALVLAALLALSPSLIFYSRIARSHAPIVLIGFGAAAAFEAWWRTTQRARLARKACGVAGARLPSRSRGSASTFRGEETTRGLGSAAGAERGYRPFALS